MDRKFFQEAFVSSAKTAGLGANPDSWWFKPLAIPGMN
jgi:hypothetical protein